MKLNFTLLFIGVFIVSNFAFAQVTITLQPDSACGKDAIIADCVPCGYYNGNYGSDDEFAAIAWTNGGNISDERGLLQFDLSGIPNTATVISAKLSLYWNPNPASGNPGHSQLSGSNAAWLQRITSSWTEFGVTWANQPTTTIVNQVALPASTTNNQDYPNIDVTAMVQDMVTNPSQGFGFMIKLQTETFYRSLLFASSDHPNAALHPKLVVTFLDTAASACLTLQPGSCTGMDAIIADCVPCGYYNTNYGSADELGAIAWTNGGNPSNERGLLQFDIGSIPTSATVTSAKLSLYWNPNPASGNPGHSQLSGSNAAWLQRITSAWTEYGVTWANQPSTTTQNEVALAASTTNNQDYTNIDVKALVQDMVSNPSQSFGFMLRLQTEVYYRSLLFASSDHPNPALHPKLEVCYIMPPPCTSLVLQPDSAAGKDAQIWSCHATNNSGSNNDLDPAAWTVMGNSCIGRGLVKFDLTSISSGSLIQSATLTLYNNPTSVEAFGNGSHSQLSGSNKSSLRRITSGWTEFGVTWNNQPSTTTLNEVTIPADTNPHENYVLDVRQLVQDMVNSPATSFGFMLQLDTESYYRALIFASSDNADSTIHPKLEICYIANSSLPVSQFQSSDTTFCSETGKCINFFDHSTGNPISWKWYFPGASPDSSVQQNPTGICYSTTGTYAVTLIATNAAGSDTVNVSPMITVANPPATPLITINGDTLKCSHACSYQWYFNGAPIAGATDSFYVAVQTGTYSVRISDCIGCNVFSNGSVFPVGIEELNGELQIKINPNPVVSSFTVQFSKKLKNATLVIYNIVGKEVMRKKITGDRMEIEKGSLVSGVYFIKVISEKNQWVEKIVVE